jgi:hypothetical protein
MNMKLPILCTTMLALALLSPVPARAQEVSAYLGFGSAYANSTGAQIETFSDGTLYKTPTLTGAFGHIGGDVFLKKTFAVGGEISWRFPAGDYAGIPYRPTFYSADAIYRPNFRKGRWEPELRLGLGGARVNFFPNDPVSCSQVPGCPASDHFQQHAAVAARWYFSDHFFLRPAIDVHHVDHLYEFGTNWVPEFSLGIGYSVGRSE